MLLDSWSPSLDLFFYSGTPSDKSYGQRLADVCIQKQRHASTHAPPPSPNHTSLSAQFPPAPPLPIIFTKCSATEHVAVYVELNCAIQGDTDIYIPVLTCFTLSSWPSLSPSEKVQLTTGSLVPFQPASGYPVRIMLEVASSHGCWMTLQSKAGDFPSCLIFQMGCWAASSKASLKLMEF